MIEVVVRIGSDGLMNRVRAQGHSGLGIAGTDVVCAAVTALLRTAARVLESDSLVQVDGAASRRGDLEFEVREVPDSRRQWFRGVQDSLLFGIADIAAEEPGHCSLTTEQQR